MTCSGPGTGTITALPWPTTWDGHRSTSTTTLVCTSPPMDAPLPRCSKNSSVNGRRRCMSWRSSATASADYWPAAPIITVGRRATAGPRTYSGSAFSARRPTGAPPGPRYWGGAAGHRGPKYLQRLVFLGTPHHGSALERAGNWVNVLLGLTPYTSPLARIASIRSAGIAAQVSTRLNSSHL